MKRYLALMVMAALATGGVVMSLAEAQTPLYSEAFGGAPSSPEPLGANSSPDGLSAFVWREFGGPIPAEQVWPMQAQHGSNCEAPGHDGAVTHQTSGAVEESVYRCADHLMTAIDHAGRTYGQVTLRPHVQATLPMTIRFDTSTLRTSSRDWTAITVSPVSDALLAPYELSHDLDGLPVNGLHVMLDPSFNSFGSAKVINGGSVSDIQENRSLSWDANGIVPSAQDRRTVEIVVTATTLTTRIQRDDGTWLTWFDEYPISPVWAGGDLYVQFSHFSYDPDKGSTIPAGGTPSENTWHWGNITIEAGGSTETVIRANPYVLYDFGTSGVITLDEPAEGTAWFSFTDFGAGMTVSIDGASPQAITPRDSVHGSGRGATGSVVLPAGSQVLTFSCAGGLPCEVRGLEVVGEVSVVPTPIPTPTPEPICTLTATDGGGVVLYTRDEPCSAIVRHETD